MEDVHIPEKYTDHSEKMMSLLSEFSVMWDGNLGRIKAFKHRIELNSTKIRPIYLALYRAGPNARQFDKAEIYKMLSQKVIEPSQT